MKETLHGRAGDRQHAHDGVRPFSEGDGAEAIEHSRDRTSIGEGGGVGACAPAAGVAGFLERLRKSQPDAFERIQRAVPEVVEAAALPPGPAARERDRGARGESLECAQQQDDARRASESQGNPVDPQSTESADTVRQAILLVAAAKSRQLDVPEGPIDFETTAPRRKPVRSAEVDLSRAQHASDAAEPETQREPTASECEQAERARYRHEQWKRHRPQQGSSHHNAPGFGAWIEANPARMTDAPSALTSLIDARTLAPALLEPAVPAKLNELAAYYESEENPDGSVTVQRVEPFGDVRMPLKPLTRAERKRMRSDEQRYQEYVMRADAATRRWAAWWREIGESTEHLPPTACPETYAMCRAVVCSREAADAALHMIGNNFGGNVLWRVMRSAFGDPDAPKWDTSDLCARRQIAIELFMLRQSRLKLAGRDRFGKPIMQPCVWGIGRGYLQSLLADPYSKKPLSRERLTHSNDSCMGIFHKAEAALVFVRQSKIPPEVADHDEIGPSGYTFNRYWTCRHWNPKRALRAEPDGVTVQEASQRAWLWVDAGVHAALRGRFLRPTASVDQKWVARYEVPS